MTEQNSPESQGVPSPDKVTPAPTPEESRTTTVTEGARNLITRINSRINRPNPNPDMILNEISKAPTEAQLTPAQENNAEFDINHATQEDISSPNSDEQTTTDLPKQAEREKEMFRWPPKDEFVRLRDKFVRDIRPAVESKLTRSHVDETNLSILTDAFSRSMFVADYLESNSNYANEENPEIGINYFRNNDQVSTGAITTADFSIYGNKLGQGELLSREIPPESIGDVRVSDITVNYNLAFWEQQADIAKQAVVLAASVGLPEEGAEKLRKLMGENVGILAERVMVEEMAHAFYFRKASGDPKRMARVMESQDKEALVDFTTQDHTPESAKGYLDDHLERAASYWVRPFLKEYYPDSPLAQEEKLQSSPSLKLSEK